MSEAEAALDTAINRQGIALLLAAGRDEPAAGEQPLCLNDGQGVLLDDDEQTQPLDPTQARAMLAHTAGEYAGALAVLERARRRASMVARAAVGAGLSVQEVAALVGVPWATAYQWTAGR